MEKMEQVFKKIGFAEGFSFLALLFVAMPLKYFWGEPIYVRWAGTIHGILFIMYAFAAYDLATEQKWSMKKRVHAFLAAVLPFGPFVFDRKYLSRAN